MEKSLKGHVVVTRFPFSDLTGSKKRPALILADWDGDDVILTQNTSKANKDVYAINLNDRDFASGSLHQESFVRPNKLFTADRTSFLNFIGHLNNDKMKKITTAICSILS